MKRVLTKKEVNHIKSKYDIRMDHFVIKDGLLDINGDFYMSNTKLKRLPFHFGKVYGNFYCTSNELTSLKGCPELVGGIFNCNDNNLTSLRYGPKEVGADYICSQNNLEDLKGCPTVIKGSFNCSLNEELRTLKYSPHTVGDCYMHHNQLTTLLGGPQIVNGCYHVSSNSLSDLIGFPLVVKAIASFDNDVKMDIGKHNSDVKEIVIQLQEKRLTDPKKCTPKIVLDNVRFLPTVFKYFKYLNFYNSDGSFNEGEFSDIILDIKEGLR